MQRFWEIIFGLERGFLSREGELSLRFNPLWPWKETVGAGVWNVLLIGLAVALVVWVYRREGRSRPARISLGALRALLLLFLIGLLNRPVLTLGQSRTEPSVLAILVDDSVSMRVRDAGGPADRPVSRLEAATQLLSSEDRKLLRELSRRHVVRLYRFDQDAYALETVLAEPDGADADPDAAPEADALEQLKPQGQHTQLLRAVDTVMHELQGQRLAGVVVLSDGRQTPTQPVAEALATIKDYGVKVYPIAVGSDQVPSNIEVQSISVQETAFKGDIVNVRATVRAAGVPPDRPIVMQLRDQKTGRLLNGLDGRAEQQVRVEGDQPTEIELQFKPEEIGTLDLVVEAMAQPGELDDQDNSRSAQVAVLDAKIAVLYVDGYPRWEYRYIKNEMIRDRTVDISCLLTSADPSFAQEGDRPIRRFPESIEELAEYDVILFGDVSPRQFTDSQLQLVAEFVSRRGGGFGMVAGPSWSPEAYRNTAIEPILPVSLGRVDAEADQPYSAEGFRPVLTREGESSSVFRFYADRELNHRFLTEQIQPLFWYSRGVAVKPGVGEVLAVHPDDLGPDGRKAPILVLGRYGAGRSLFSAIDDSWRWRFYTGESVFDTYWVQQIRYLARSKKLGQRKLTFVALRPAYELGQQVQVRLRLLDPLLIQQLPEQIRVQLEDAAGQVVSQQTLVRQEGENDVYLGSWPADQTGRLVVRLPAVAGAVDEVSLPIDVIVPRLELTEPRVDRTFLSRLASETLGQPVELSQAAGVLPELIPSAARVILLDISQPLWDAPLALFLVALLVSSEWVLRKMYGMV
jgi:uncharacterized membrane protein